MSAENRYQAIIERIFFSRFITGAKEVRFQREEMVKIAAELKIALPKNLGDLVYSFRYRAALPKSIQKTAAEGKVWIIRPAGRAEYLFALVPDVPIVPNTNLAETKIPDATPGIVAKHAFSDEQALLAKLRYNRLIDIFTGVTCYSLQNHLRTTVPGMGQLETDEIYVGVDKRGVQFVIPVQAKGGSDKLNIVQIEQDFGICEHKFPGLISRPVAAQFMQDGVIALFEFEQSEDGIKIVSERHYRLVPPNEVTAEDLKNYAERLSQ